MDCCNEKQTLNKAYVCPQCNHLGEKVNIKTIQSLLSIQKDLKDNVNYYLCFNKDCDVAYYNDVDDIILKSEIKVPIWFKNGADPKYICYCSKVTEEEITDAIVNKNSRTVKDVVKNTNAMKNSNCVINSPTGKCCSRQINDLLKSINK